MTRHGPPGRAGWGLAEQVRLFGERAVPSCPETCPGTEMAYPYPFGWVYEMRDGALSHVWFYSGHAETLDAVGLPQ